MVFIPPEIVVFEDAVYGGKQRRFNHDVSNASWYSTYLPGEIPHQRRHSWDEKISSVIVISGTWQFFTEPNYTGTHSNQVAPGGYLYVENPEFNIANDTISSFRVISYDPQGDGFIWV